MPRPSDRRSTSSANCRGSSYDRRARRQWLLDTYGDGETCACWIQTPGICEGRVNAETLSVDRIVPGVEGGRYTRDNILPSCLPCNIARGDNYLEGHPNWSWVLDGDPPPRAREYEGCPI